MAAPLVSIIVPTFNRAPMLGQALDSVLAQDYEPIELIVLDDGSTDETPQLLADYRRRHGSERLKTERHENIGQALTVNRGLELAGGEILGELSSDDWLLPGAVRRQVEALEANPEAEVVSGSNYVVDEHGDIIDTIVPQVDTFAAIVRDQQFSIAVGALLRRELYERVGGWNPEYRSCPDYDFFLRAGPSLRHTIVPDVVGAIRSHADRITDASLGLEMARERWRLLDSLFADETLASLLADVRDEAYANLFILSAVTTLGSRLNGPDQRWLLCDTQAILRSRAAERHEQWDTLRRQFRVDMLSRQLQLQLQLIEDLRQTIRTQSETLDHLEVALAERDALPATTAGSPATAAIPPWWTAARVATPAPLRHRIGVLAHRIVLPRLKGSGRP